MDKIAQGQCGVRRLQAIGGTRIFMGQEGRRMIKRVGKNPGGKYVMGLNRREVFGMHEVVTGVWFSSDFT